MEIEVVDLSHANIIPIDEQLNKPCSSKISTTISQSPSPTFSHDDVFSVISCTSSNSSIHTTNDECETLALSFTSIKPSVETSTSLDQFEFIKPALPVSIQENQTKAGIQLDNHPRRSLSINKPPTLCRQEERKNDFVNKLVDSVTGLITAIWPRSTRTTRSCNGRKVLELQTYVKEALRRSRTSFSTLQVALYYLILIKTFLNKNDLSEYSVAEQNFLGCGRRVFFMSLLLASKYLQDRNYSTQAWCKMSGLTKKEMASNERAFLHAVNWNVHITEHVYNRWTKVMMKSTHSGLDSSSQIFWKSIIHIVNPKLDDLLLNHLIDDGFIGQKCSDDQHITQTITPATTPPILSPFDLTFVDLNPFGKRAESTAPNVEEKSTGNGITSPVSPKLGPLPTPSMAPSSILSMTPMSMSSSTPAVSSSCHTRDTNTSQVSNPYFCMNAASLLIAKRCSSITPSLSSSWSSPASMMTDYLGYSRGLSVASTLSFPAYTSLNRQTPCLNLQNPSYNLHTFDSSLTCSSINQDLSQIPNPIGYNTRSYGTNKRPIHIPDDIGLTNNGPIHILDDVDLTKSSNANNPLRIISNTSPTSGSSSLRKRNRSTFEPEIVTNSTFPTTVIDVEMLNGSSVIESNMNGNGSQSGFKRPRSDVLHLTSKRLCKSPDIACLGEKDSFVQLNNDVWQILD